MPYVDPEGTLLVRPHHKADTRFDYGSRTDDSPEFVGQADAGTATSVPKWIIMKLTWETAPNGKPRLVRMQTRVGAWDNRASLGW
jgi:hypothetical protein